MEELPRFYIGSVEPRTGTTIVMDRYSAGDGPAGYAICEGPKAAEAASRIVELLNADEEVGPRQPGRRIFPDGERYEFLRPADVPARRVDMSGRSRFVHQARDPGEAGRALAEAVGGMGPPRARPSPTEWR